MLVYPAQTVRIRLFLYSFLILFLELSLIRFIPANIRLIGYFSNVILLATFLGMGCGMMLTKRTTRFHPLFPYVLFSLLLIITVFSFGVATSAPDTIFFTVNSDKFIALEPQYILPIMFLLVAVANIPLAQELGTLFGQLPPLEAYTYDVAGSISGVAVFTVLSFLSTPATVWFILVTALFSYLGYRKSSGYIIGVVVCIACLALVAFSEKGALWSPYYKITTAVIHDALSPDPAYAINVNTIPNQYISRYSSRESFYYTPYQIFHGYPFKRILIIGAGTGADTATALALDPGVEHIDAVEIDPDILTLGRTLNPDAPFSDPRVSVHNDDGRSFLQNSHDQYDLVIYALTDSLALAAKSANIRLESFIFTTEAFKLVSNHLTHDGLFVLYNYYRQNWLIDKIVEMTNQTFGYQPVVVRYGVQNRAAVILTGPKIQSLGSSWTRYVPKEHITPASDNWPFLYLKQPSIPSLYSSFIALLVLLSIALVALIGRGTKNRVFDLRFFCFGAGFMLLETKSLAVFALLFGSTWLVNAMVICALLLFVLLANFINMRHTITHIVPWYVLLFAFLIFQWFVPPALFIGLAFLPRLLIASTFYFCPVFFANVIFSQRLKLSKDAQEAFGVNLLGALMGGFLEYLALAVGYQALILLIILLYGVSLIRPNTLR